MSTKSISCISHGDCTAETAAMTCMMSGTVVRRSGGELWRSHFTSRHTNPGKHDDCLHIFRCDRHTCRMMLVLTPVPVMGGCLR